MFKVKFYSKLLNKVITKIFNNFLDAKIFASNVNGIIY